MHRSIRIPWNLIRRKGLLFFVVAILLIAFVSLMTMFVQTERIPGSMQVELNIRDVQERARIASQGKSQREIMQRISYLEEEIARNREAQSILKQHVELIRNNLSDPSAYEQLLELLADRDRASDADKKSLDGPYSRQEVDFIQKCPRSYAYDAKADVSIPELYDELPFDNPDGGVWKQGWPIEERPELWNSSYKLFVHVVPHSHQDPGWVKTIDDYYSGQVRPILDSTFTTLSNNPNYRFIYAEMCFLDTYFSHANNEKQQKVKQALESKQMEIVTGGWVMTDEASSHVYAMLDQLVEGHLYVNSTFSGNVNTRSKSSWSIDPFGYSTTVPYLLAKSGIHDLFIQRVHYVLKKRLARSKQLEFRWRQPFDKTGQHEVLTHVMPFYSYDIPHTCGPEPAVCCQFDFMRQPGDRISCPWHFPAQAITTNNVADRARLLLSQYRKHATLFRTNQLLVILGDDFRYDSLNEFSRQFDNYDKIFKHLNGNKDANVNIKWSTLHEYFSAVRYAAPPLRENLMPAAMPTLVGDFHTYADRDDHYWSGYFTSRPFQKWMSRQLEFHLRSAEQLTAFAATSGDLEKFAPFNAAEALRVLRQVRRALGIFQHHDSITGTSKDFVVQDNGVRLLKALNAAKELINSAGAYLLLRGDAENTAKKSGKSDEKVQFSGVFKMNELYSDHNVPPVPIIVNVDSAAHIVLYNSLTIRRATLHSMRVSTPFVGVFSVAEGRFVEAQIDPVWNHECDILKNAYQLTFRADIAPLSFSKYRLVHFADEETMKKRSHSQLARLTLHNWHARYADLTKGDEKQFLADRFGPFSVRLNDKLDFIDLQTERLKLRVSSHTGMLSTVSVDGGAQMRAEMSYIKYSTTSGRERSGAYLFLPDGPAKAHVAEQPLIRTHRGSLTDEVHVAIQYVNHTLRLTKARGVLSTDFIELHNLVDIRSSFNTELGFRLQTDANTGADDDHSQFYADQNCFQMAKRKSQMPKIPLQGNVYPFTCAAFLDDAKSGARVTLLSQQSLGVASLKRGALEVILDRRLNQDDNRGLEQGVVDNRLTPSTFRIHFSVPDSEVRKELETAADEGPSNKQLDLLSHWNMVDLNNPMLMFVPQSEAADAKLEDDPRNDYSPFPKRLSLAQTGAAFPCDSHLVNVRLNADGSSGSAVSTAVFLHRFGTDCDWLPDTLRLMRKFCATNTNGMFDLHQLFDRSRFKQARKISRTSLTLLDELKDVSIKNATVAVDAFEIEAFRLFF